VTLGRLALGAAVAWQRAALARRAKAFAILVAVGFVLAAIAVTFGTTAIYFLLAPEFGPPAAAGLIAAVAMALLVALLLVARWRAGRRRRVAAALALGPSPFAPLLGSVRVGAASDPIGATLISAAAGLALGLLLRR
jgi:hypothetical protein